MLLKKGKRHTQSGATGCLNALMATQLENEPFSSFDDSSFHYHLPKYYRALLQGFRRLISSTLLFHALFISLLSLEISSLFFTTTSSSLFALVLALLLLTGFSYTILLFYHTQAKKPGQLHRLKDQFIASCSQHLLTKEPGHHLFLAEALLKLFAYLQDFESTFYKIPRLFQPFSRIIRRFSARCYRIDVFHMKHLLLTAAIEEHLKQIRSSPTDLEIHASLASSYVFLSRLYREFLPFCSPRKQQPLFEEKFRSAAQLAIEEFRILNDYAPNDPWVHEQLAAGYQALQMPEEEVREMETLLKLRPQDKEILFQLGMLYFQQGQNAKGLQVYEDLKQSHYRKAEDLIARYGKSLQI